MSDGSKEIGSTGRPKPPNAGKGRPKGSVNKVTADVRALAQKHGEAAIQALVDIMKGAEQPPAARVSAAKEILDRAYGKSPQPISDADGTSLTDAVNRLIAGLPN